MGGFMLGFLPEILEKSAELIFPEDAEQKNGWILNSFLYFCRYEMDWRTYQFY